MAHRPWVTPDEVKAYSEYPSVISRASAKLCVDISRAEQHVIAFTNNTFDELDVVPPPVKTAVILVAEAFAYNACLASREMQSETFDNYSYTAANATPIDVSLLDLSTLLDGFCKVKVKGDTTLRMRKL